MLFIKPPDFVPIGLPTIQANYCHAAAICLSLHIHTGAAIFFTGADFFEVGYCGVLLASVFYL